MRRAFIEHCPGCGAKVIGVVPGDECGNCGCVVLDG